MIHTKAALPYPVGGMKTKRLCMVTQLLQDLLPQDELSDHDFLAILYVYATWQAVGVHSYALEIIDRVVDMHGSFHLTNAVVGGIHQQHLVEEHALHRRERQSQQAFARDCGRAFSPFVLSQLKA